MENNKFGYYKVGDHFFDSKIKALLYASDTGKTPTWHFHSKVYKKQNWIDPSVVDLEILYAERAKQLREKYDYLVLSFSGGSDSWTALDAFKNAGQHLDEILLRWPVKASSGKYIVDNSNKHASNILSEWDLTIVPLIKEIEKTMPRTKISLIDWSDKLLTTEIADKDWTDTIPQEYLNVGASIKWSLISEDEQKAIDKGLKTCFISGIDKPQLWVNEGKVYCYFIDKLANAFYNQDLAKSQGRNCEHFYWTSDFPEITVTQAKYIYINLKLNTAMCDLINKNRPYDAANKRIWNHWTRSIIYPKYSRLGLFQANKSYTHIYDEVDNWIFKLNNLRFTDSWRYGLKNVLNSIDKKYLSCYNNEVVGFTGFIDGEYFLGSI